LYILVCLNILILGLLNDLGYIHHTHNDSSIEAAILITIILTLIGYSGSLLAKDIHKINKNLIQNKNKLEKRVKERTAELEQSLDNLTNTQEQLIESEKMASLGRLVAGVAHEINNPLGIAITASSHIEDANIKFSALYEKNTITKSQLSNYIELSAASSKIIVSNLQRAAHLVQSFKDIAVDQTSEECRKFNLIEYLSEVLDSLQPSISQTKYLVELSCESEIHVYSSPGVIAQIITNLFFNSITHGFENMDTGTISIQVVKNKNNIHITYNDSGCGISPENLPKLFEPFFTTKRGFGGTGLGMHIVYNLVKQSLAGNITCTSALGEGTQFDIVFPEKMPSEPE